MRAFAAAWEKGPRVYLTGQHHCLPRAGLIVRSVAPYDLIECPSTAVIWPPCAAFSNVSVRPSTRLTAVREG